MDENIRMKLDGLADEADVIIANPDDIEKLKNQGLPPRLCPQRQLMSFFKNVLILR